MVENVTALATLLLFVFQAVVGYVGGSVAGFGIGLLVTIVIALPFFLISLVYKGYRKEMDKP